MVSIGTKTMRIKKEVPVAYTSRKAKTVWANKLADSVPSAKAVAEVQFRAMQAAKPEKLSAHSVRLDKPEAVRTTTLGSVPQPVARHLSLRHRQASGLNA